MPIFNNPRDNSNIYYEVHGQGSPIVLIHGFGLDSRIWKHQVEELSKNHTVITYDVRGFGKSSKPTGEYKDYEDLHDLLVELKINHLKPTIVGHSAGAEIAVEYALTYKEDTGGLFLISPALNGIKGDDTELKEIAELWEAGKDEEAREKMRNHNTFKDVGGENYELCMEMINKYDGCHFKNKQFSKRIRSSEKLAELKGIRIKAVIGESDENTQKKVMEKLKNESDNENLGIKTEIIEGVGHMSIITRDNLISKDIHEFDEGKKEYDGEYRKENDVRSETETEERRG